MLYPNSPDARLGSDLHPLDRQHVLAAYVHRFTRQHMPQWALKSRADGSAYPVQFNSDADWLAHTWFAVKANGRLDRRHNSCYSSPTWPDHPELRPKAPLVGQIQSAARADA